MSVNITVAVPLETVLAIQNADDNNSSVDAVADITSGTTRAVIDAVKALSYQLTPKIVTKIKPNAAPISTPASSTSGGKRKRETQNDKINVAVQTMGGTEYHVAVDQEATAEGLAEAIHFQSGIPPVDQRLVHGGKLLRHGATLQSVSEHSTRSLSCSRVN